MSQPWPFPYRFIAIEGNIGAGKTTLTRKIAEDHDCRLILEQFTDNPFLPLFYDNPDRYAFQLELFFMSERHKQLQTELGLQELFRDSVVADYFFLKTLLFAKNNLTEEEFRLFQRLFKVLNSSFVKPDLLIYLHRPVEVLMKLIQKRSRQFETSISPDYLQQVQQAYLAYFRQRDDIPIVIINLEEMDFESNDEHYQMILRILEEPFLPGLHQLNFSSSD